MHQNAGFCPDYSAPQQMIVPLRFLQASYGSASLSNFVFSFDYFKRITIYNDFSPLHTTKTLRRLSVGLYSGVTVTPQVDHIRPIA